MEFGIHIADFTWTGGPATLGADLARHVRDAEAAGITRITVMDHFWQLHGIGPESHEMLEAYATLGFLVAHTEKALLHTLVSGVIYREPALLIKQVTTLNVLSGGRVGLGIGAGWNEAESRGLGFAFPTTGERFERLEETLQIALQMWSDEEEPFDGQHYHLGRALNSPQSLTRPRPYLMIGGGGERKTLRLVAQYADACNFSVSPESAHKLEVLARHCDDLGRDYAEIEKTCMFPIHPDSTVDDIVRTADEMAELGFTASYIFAAGITDRARIIDLLGAALPRVQQPV